MARKRSSHPNTSVEKAVTYAEEHGWRVVMSKGHAWGKMYCPARAKYKDCRCGEFCITSIWRTPKNPENLAKQLSRVVDNCIRTRDKEN